MGHPIKEDRMLFQAGTYLGFCPKKIDMTAVNMLNLGEPITCVDSQYTKTE